MKHNGDIKKRILIDATTVTTQVDGLSHNIINLIKYIPKETFDYFEYTVVYNKGLNRKSFQDLFIDSPIKLIEATIAPIGPRRDWDMFWFLKKYQKQFDVIHITSNNYPFALRKGICTIHDITFKKYFDNPKYTFGLATFYMDKVIRNALKSAKKIIAVSNATKTDLIATYGLNDTISNKINVAHPGWEHLINEKSSDDATCADTSMVNGNYLLYIGTFRIHKNISNLLIAFKKVLPKLDAAKRLVIIGDKSHLKPSDAILINEINATEEKVVFTGYLSQACVEAYLKNTDAYIFPSISEGFGLGVLEAFYYKAPLLCSNATSLPEVAGDAALFFDPYNPDDIAATIEKFYNNKDYPKQLVEKGTEQLKSFSWQKYAKDVVDVYKAYFGISVK